MSHHRLVWIAVTFLSITATAFAQKSSTASTTSSGTTPVPSQDPQGISVLNQAINAAGGASAIATVSDYTATGNITYYPGKQVQGTVTFQGLGGREFRMDVTLPSGTQSWAVDQGIISVKSVTGVITALKPNKNAPSSDAFPYQTPLFPSSLAFPSGPVGAIINTRAYGIKYVGSTQVDGHSVQDISIAEGTFLAPGATGSIFPIRTRDIFVDSSTFQIVMTRDTLPKGVSQELHYSNYQVVNGVAMPFTISNYLGGELVWAVDLNQINFNAGLQESTFAIQ